MRGHRLGTFLRFIAGGMALVAVTPAYAAPAAEDANRSQDEGQIARVAGGQPKKDSISVAALAAAPAAPASAQELCMGERPTTVGTSGTDRLEGTPGRDVIVALNGDDTVEAHDGDDLICAGGGHDRVYARAGDDRVDGGSGRDRIRGGDGNDDLDGGWEVDLLVGSKGDDRLSGGPLHDPFIDRAVYVGSASPISADLAAGRVTGAAIGTDELRCMEGVVGTSGADELLGNGLPNDLVGRGGDDTIDGRGGADTIFGGERDPWWQTDDGRDVVHGGGGDDRISGGFDSDELFGDGGNDILMSLGLWAPTQALALEGPGTLHGGEGDDELVSGPADDTLDGNDGLDLVSFTYGDAGVRVDLRAQSALGRGVDALVSIEGAVGTSFVDSLRGDDGPNVLDGYGDGDTVRGFGGDDRLSGASGTEAPPLMLDGGEGDDELSLLGSAAGTVGGGTLAGGPGDDVLRGLLSGYTLDGGEGADTAAYSFYETGTVIDLARGEASLNHEQCPEAQGCFEDSLVSIENAEGGNADDILLGNDAPNVLVGLQKQDRIEGGGGDDTIDGGPGADSADGGAGDDSCANVEVAVSC